MSNIKTQEYALQLLLKEYGELSPGDIIKLMSSEFNITLNEIEITKLLSNHLLKTNIDNFDVESKKVEFYEKNYNY